MIVDPMTMSPDAKVSDALEMMKRTSISGVPVTRRRQAGRHPHQSRPAFRDPLRYARREAMTKDNLITVPVGTTLEQAEAILHEHRVEKLLVVDEKYQAQGLDHGQGHPEENEVSQRRQRRARPPARGRGFGRDRRLPGTRRRTGRAKVDVLVVDTAHGHHDRVMEAVKRSSRRCPRSNCWPAMSPPSTARAT